MSTAWDSSHAPSVPWRSGPWSLELRDDELAEVRFDGRRVLRSIRAVVRDRDWNTAALTVESVTAADDALVVALSTTAFGAEVRGTVRAAADGDDLQVTFDAISGTEFQTNRTGLVVLHPYQVAGAELAVTHSGGDVEQTRFPREISPHQPVFDIAALEWADDGVEASVAFAGDVFEMEDQRNWTDASFKTYSRPLALPFPYLLPAGGLVRQSVTLHARMAAADPHPSVPNSGDERRHADDGCPDPARHESRPQLSTAPEAAPARIDLQAGDGFPSVGLGAATAPDPAPDAAPLGDFVLVELDLASPNWRAALTRAAASGKPLDVRFLLDADLPLALVDAVAALPGREVLRVAPFQQARAAQHVSDQDAVVALRAALAAAGVDVPVVGGARSHFTELNREQHRLPEDLDGLTVAVTPLFHAHGTEQLIESIAMQRLVAEQTVEFAKGRPVHVGPIALRPRFNHLATVPQPGPTRTDLGEGYGAEFTGAADPRQQSPELAAWVMASAAALAIPGVASIAYFEEWGARGIRSPSGEPFPVAAAIALLAEQAAPGARRLWGDSPDGLVWAIGAQDAAGSTVLVANLDARPREIAVAVAGQTATVRVEAFGFARVVIG